MRDKASVKKRQEMWTIEVARCDPVLNQFQDFGRKVTTECTMEHDLLTMSCLERKQGH